MKVKRYITALILAAMLAPVGISVRGAAPLQALGASDPSGRQRGSDNSKSAQDGRSQDRQEAAADDRDDEDHDRDDRHHHHHHHHRHHHSGDHGEDDGGDE